MLTAILILASISTLFLLLIFPIFVSMMISMETMKKDLRTSVMSAGYGASKSFQVDERTTKILTMLEMLSEGPPQPQPQARPMPSSIQGMISGADVSYRTLDGKYNAANLEELFKKMMDDPSYFSTDGEVDDLREAFGGFSPPPSFDIDAEVDLDEEDDAR